MEGFERLCDRVATELGAASVLAPEHLAEVATDLADLLLVAMDVRATQVPMSSARRCI